MNDLPLAPSVENIATAAQKFDTENEVVEAALTELIRVFPTNTTPSHVLLKVVAINTLYRTNIFGVETVAKHITQHGAEIDTLLRLGSPEAVEKFKRIDFRNGPRWTFSFATKYSSWHNQSAYPIYDTRVVAYLRHYNKQKPILEWVPPDKWDYPTFLSIVQNFRVQYGLVDVDFKQLDKFLFYEGEKLMGK